MYFMEEYQFYNSIDFWSPEEKRSSNFLRSLKIKSRKFLRKLKRIAISNNS